MKRLIALIGLMLSLSACANYSDTPPRPKLPSDVWWVGLAAPRYMEVWVEQVDVLDQRKIAFFNVHGGVASYTRSPEGWHRGGGGSSMPLSWVDLPLEIVVRWQSLVEPQAYWINVKIPQWVRDEMVKPERVFCKADQAVVTLYRDSINIGMAPGGIVKVWVGAGCLGYKEIGRFQAHVEPRGPGQDGRWHFYRKPTPEAQDWIDKHGIPYGTW